MMKNCRHGIRDLFFKKGRRRVLFLIAWVMILLQASVLTGCASGQGSASGKEGVASEASASFAPERRREMLSAVNTATTMAVTSATST